MDEIGDGGAVTPSPLRMSRAVSGAPDVSAIMTCNKASRSLLLTLCMLANRRPILFRTCGDGSHVRGEPRFEVSPIDDVGMRTVTNHDTG